MQATGEKWIILGASRGLGHQFSQKTLHEKACLSLALSSRKIEKSNFSDSEIFLQKWTFDFANESQWEAILSQMIAYKPDRIFYFAGGGPYGNYQDKAWKDHQWAYRLNFLFPAFLLHQVFKIENLKQLLFVGSAIAESAVDPGASSYAASKHALKGLITTVQAEIKKAGKNLDLRLYSPGYMDTDLLPPDAWPRQQIGKVLPTDKVVDDLWQWLRSQHDANTQRIFSDKSLLK